MQSCWGRSGHARIAVKRRACRPASIDVSHRLRPSPPPHLPPQIIIIIKTHYIGMLSMFHRERHANTNLKSIHVDDTQEIAELLPKRRLQFIRFLGIGIPFQESFRIPFFVSRKLCKRTGRDGLVAMLFVGVLPPPRTTSTVAPSRRSGPGQRAETAVCATSTGNPLA